MWDTKRQLVWLIVGTTLGTFVIYGEAFDEAGRFDPTYFAILETLLLTIIAVMFYIYSKK